MTSFYYFVKSIQLPPRRCWWEMPQSPQCSYIRIVVRRHLLRICVPLDWVVAGITSGLCDSASFNKKPNDLSRPSKEFNRSMLLFDVISFPWILLFFFLPFQPSSTLYSHTHICKNWEAVFLFTKTMTARIYRLLTTAATKGGPFSHAADRVWRAYFPFFFSHLTWSNLFADCNWRD